MLPFKRGGLVIGNNASRLVWPRWLARVWARLFGYFWLPCPVCKEPFAGFEWGRYSMMTGDQAGTGVCARPSCQEVAKKSTEEYFAALGERLVVNKGGLWITEKVPTKGSLN